MDTPKENVVLESLISYPRNIQILFSKFEEIEQLHVASQKNADAMRAELKTMKKLLAKHFKKTLINEKASKRKPCGFAVPSHVTQELCDFMEKEHGTLISRTETTKYLMTYISENKLQNPDNKQIILPDNKLYALLGEDSKKVDITHFTIQRFINVHFPKKETKNRRVDE